MLKINDEISSTLLILLYYKAKKELKNKNVVFYDLPKVIDIHKQFLIMKALV